MTARTVASLLAGAGYSLQGNAKTVEGKQHPDRDAQFRYINAQVTAFQADGSPVISVDAKKKENVGNFKNGGAESAPAGQPERVSVHDFPDEELGKVTPYGSCDLTANTGWVNVGTDHDTGAFAVASIRSWWNGPGGPPTPAPGACWSPLIPAGPTAPGCGCGRPSWPRSPPRPAWTSPCCTCHREPASGTK